MWSNEIWFQIVFILGKFFILPTQFKIPDRWVLTYHDRTAVSFKTATNITLGLQLYLILRPRYIASWNFISFC